MTAQVKVVLRHATLGAKSGETISVDKDAADRLVENGHATRAKSAAKDTPSKE